MVYKATYNWGAPSCGAITILKNHGVRQWGWDDIPYMKWKITIHIPNHQPGLIAMNIAVLSSTQVVSDLIDVSTCRGDHLR